MMENRFNLDAFFPHVTYDRISCVPVYFPTLSFSVSIITAKALRHVIGRTVYLSLITVRS